MDSERLYDCHVTYHLNGGQAISESFRNDIPSEVWQDITQRFSDLALSMELQPSDHFAKVLLPKSNISYITLKLSASS